MLEFHAKERHCLISQCGIMEISGVLESGELAPFTQIPNEPPEREGQAQQSNSKKPL